MKNFYDILKVGRDANQSEIKRAYFNELKKYHPDVTDFDKTYAEERTKEITEAYKILSDETAREAYDELLKNFENITYKQTNHHKDKQHYNNYNATCSQNMHHNAYKNNDVPKSENIFQNNKSDNTSFEKTIEEQKNRGFRDFILCFIVMFIVESCLLMYVLDFSKMEIITFDTKPQHVAQIDKNNEYNTYGEQDSNEAKKLRVKREQLKEEYNRRLDSNKNYISEPKNTKENTDSVNKAEVVNPTSTKKGASKSTPYKLEAENKPKESKQKTETETNNSIDYNKYYELRIGNIYAGMLVDDDKVLVPILGKIKKSNWHDWKHKHDPKLNYKVSYEYGYVKVDKKTKRLYSFQTRSRYDVRRYLLNTDKGITVDLFNKGEVEAIYNGYPIRIQPMGNHGFITCDMPNNIGQYVFYYKKDKVVMIEFNAKGINSNPGLNL